MALMDNWGFKLTIILLVGSTVMLFYGMYVGIQEMDAEKEVQDQCVKDNVEEIKEFTLACVQSLNVEEQAYVVDSCYYNAVKLWC